MKRILLRINDANREIDFHQLLDAGIYGLPADAVYKNAPKFKGDSTLIVVPSYTDAGVKDIHHVLHTQDAQIYTEFYSGSTSSWSDWVKESGGGSGDGATTLFVQSKKKTIVQNGKSEYDEKTKTLWIDVDAIGVPGRDGDSAYQVWLNAGHVGTVEEYIASLKGQKGDKGQDGTGTSVLVDGRTVTSLIPGKHVTLVEDAEKTGAFTVDSSGSGDGAQAILVINKDGSIKQIGKSTYDPESKTISIELNASGPKGDKGDKGDPGNAYKSDTLQIKKIGTDDTINLEADIFYFKFVSKMLTLAKPLGATALNILLPKVSVNNKRVKGGHRESEVLPDVAIRSQSFRQDKQILDLDLQVLRRGGNDLEVTSKDKSIVQNEVSYDEVNRKFKVDLSAKTTAPSSVTIFGDTERNVLYNFQSTGVFTDTLVKCDIGCSPTYNIDNYGYYDYYIAMMEQVTLTSGEFGLYSDLACKNLLATRKISLPDGGVKFSSLLYGNVDVSVSVPSNAKILPKLYEAFARCRPDGISGDIVVVDNSVAVNNDIDNLAYGTTYKLSLDCLSKTAYYMTTRGDNVVYDITISLNGGTLTSGINKVLSFRNSMAGCTLNITFVNTRGNYSTINGKSGSSFSQKYIFKIDANDSVDFFIEALKFKTNLDLTISPMDAQSPAPTPVDFPIKLWEFVGTNKVEFDPAVIPTVTSVNVKKPFPSDKIVITIPRLLDTFYHDADALCVCINTGLVETTLQGTGTKVKVGTDCLAYERPYTNGMDATKIRVDNEWVAFTFNATKLLANMALCNGNQVLITISGSKPPVQKGGLLNYPLWRYEEGSTAWHKNNLMGCSELTISERTAIIYSSSYYHNYTSDNCVVYNIDFSTNQFSSSSWTKQILFKDASIESIKSDHTIVINITAQGKVITSPYTVNMAGALKLVIPMVNKATDKIITMTCQDNQIFIG